MSHGPARIFGIAGKGRIAEGYDADFTIVDLKRRWRITNSWIASRCGWTPYDGMEVTGFRKARSCAARKWFGTARSPVLRAGVPLPLPKIQPQ